MKRLASIPLTTVVLALGAISTIGWIVWDGTLPLVISIASGAIIAIRATLPGSEE